MSAANTVAGDGEPDELEIPPLHPAANAFPQMQESELREMADDIRQNGQRYPIIMWKGQILDGRNRWLACLLAGVKPETTEFSGDSRSALADFK